MSQISNDPDIDRIEITSVVTCKWRSVCFGLFASPYVNMTDSVKSIPIPYSLFPTSSNSLMLNLTLALLTSDVSNASNRPLDLSIHATASDPNVTVDFDRA